MSNLSKGRLIDICLKPFSFLISKINTLTCIIKIGEYWPRCLSYANRVYRNTNLCRFFRGNYRIDSEIRTTISDKNDYILTHRAWKKHIGRYECIPNIRSWSIRDTLVNRICCGILNEILKTFSICCEWRKSKWFPCKYDISISINTLMRKKISKKCFCSFKSRRRNIIRFHGLGNIEYDSNIFCIARAHSMGHRDLYINETSGNKYKNTDTKKPENYNAHRSFSIFLDEWIWWYVSDSFTSKCPPQK